MYHAPQKRRNAERHMTEFSALGPGPCRRARSVAHDFLGPLKRISCRPERAECRPHPASITCLCRAEWRMP